jgi:hypothetical protein
VPRRRFTPRRSERSIDTVFCKAIEYAAKLCWADCISGTIVNQRCRTHPMPPERVLDELLVRCVDESLLEVEKLSNRQLVEIPVRRLTEVVPTSSGAPPTIRLPNWGSNLRRKLATCDQQQTGDSLHHRKAAPQ